MNAVEYKKLCNQPNAFSRSDLEATEKVLREKNLFVARRLPEILKTSIIEKPEKHESSKFNDYFFVFLSESEVSLIIDVFIDLEVDNVETDGTTTPLASFYGGIADKWINYLADVSSGKFVYNSE